MDSGRVLRFDQAKGYGFIAPDSGGDDVFLHVNDLLTPDKHLLGPGAVVQFVSEHGERGPKASEVRVLTPAPRVAPAPSPAPDPAGHAAAVHGPGDDDRAGARSETRENDDEFVDVLPIEDFRASLTESLLLVEPALTGPQIVAVREQVLAQARRYGWVTG